jgi:hypothetical protein
MAESRSRKVSVIIFLFAVFIMLAIFTGGWIYRMYATQTELAEKRTFSAVECGKYYFSLKQDSIVYDNSTVYFEIQNTIGATIDLIVVESGLEKRELNVSIAQGTTQPVSLNMSVTNWILVYPVGCRETNFRNISFEPNYYYS